MNYRDMLLMDYFDEDYDSILNERVLSNQEYRKLKNKKNRSSVEKQDMIESEYAYLASNPKFKPTMKEVQDKKAKNATTALRKKQNREDNEKRHKASVKRKAHYDSLGINQDDPEWIQRKNTIMNKHLKSLGVTSKTASPKQMHEAEVMAMRQFPNWAENTAKERGSLVKANKKLDQARKWGAKDAAEGKSKSSFLKTHKMGAGAVAAGAAGAAGAGVAVKGIHDLSVLKNPTKAKEAWKKSGSNIPFEQWLKQQKKKAGLKTAIGGITAAAGAAGAGIMGYKQAHQESYKQYVTELENVLVEEAYLEGYYGQLIAESYGYDSEYDLVMSESYDYDEDYDYYDEDYDYYDEDYDYFDDEYDYFC